MIRLGCRQLETLSMLGRPGSVMVSGGDRVTRSLLTKGLCDADSDGNGVTITSAGLRALADAADAGRITLRPKRDDIAAALSRRCSRARK